MDATLTVLLYSSLAATAAGLGAVPLTGRRRVPITRLGWANAVAAGLMLGAAYALIVDGIAGDTVLGSAGAILGVLFVFSTHRFAGTSELDLNRLDDQSPDYGYKVVTIQTLHSGPEGVAIGVAAIQDIRFGIFVALSFAVHNVAEGMVLCAVLRSRGIGLMHAAVLAIITNVNQVLLAIVTLAILTSAPVLLPVALGFAVGALVYLVMVELLP